MEESKKKKIIITIIGILLVAILAIAIYFIFFYNSKPSPETDKQSQEKKESSDLPASPTSSQKESGNNTEPEDSDTPEPSFKNKQEFTEGDLKKLTSSFVERFGSYSNHSQFSNLQDLEMFMTESMKNWAQNYIKEQSQKEYSGNYYGISTRVITSRVQEFKKEQGKAKLMMSTQRTETKRESQEEKVFDQKIQVELVRVNGDWKVDRAEWQ